jgi:hypothetical protein
MMNTETEMCYICLENLNMICYNDNKFLNCGCLNRYHIECLHEWSEIQNKCPTCRKKINEIQHMEEDNNFDLEVDDNDFFYNSLTSIFYFLFSFCLFATIL